MLEPPRTNDARRFRTVTTSLVVAKLAMHLAVLGRWDVHRDELYFIMCAKRLAAGYVDHPPMIAWITAAFGAPFDYDVRALRIAPAIASAATVALTCWIVRALGGGARAALLAGACVIAAPVFQRSGSLLCIPVFEPPLWSAAALAVVELTRPGKERWWLSFGAIVGLGLLTKHSMAIWALGLAIGTMLTPLRAAWRTRWPWLGAAVATCLFAPNAIWQARNDFATVEFLRTMSKSVLSEIPRTLFLAGVLLYANPFTIVVWGQGLVTSLRDREQLRIIGVAFLFTLAVLLVTRGKPYYIAGAFPPLFAVGAVAIERRAKETRSVPAAAYTAIVLVSGIPLALVSLPVFRVDAVDRTLEPIVGFATPPRNLTGELHDQFGWNEQAAAVTNAAAALDEAEQSRAVVLAGNYGQAAAVDVLARTGARGDVVPPAVSGHMAYFTWGVPEGRGEVAIAIGLDPGLLRELYRDVREVGRTAPAPLAWPGEDELPIWICRDPVVPLAEAWPRLKRFDHRMTMD